MPAFYPQDGQMWLAGIVRTALAGSVISLAKSSIVPNALTTLAELQAEEADYGGYAPLTIANWNAAFLSALGAAIQMPVQQFQPTDSVTPNTIGSAWIETAGGVLVTIITLPEPKALATVNDALPISEILRFGSGL